jgi:hypothetical protein
VRKKRELRIGYPDRENLNDAATLRLGIRTVAFSMQKTVSANGGETAEKPALRCASY